MAVGLAAAIRVTAAPALPRRLRALSNALAAGGAAATVLLTATAASAAPPGAGSTTTTTTTTTTTAAPPPSGGSLPASVTLSGEGSYDVAAEILGWQNGLYGRTGRVVLNYLQSGGQAGRQDLLNGNVQFAISGVPFSRSELEGLKGGPSAIIAAPIMPSAVGFLLDPPTSGFYIYHPRTGEVSAPYSGPVREPAANVVAQVLDYVNTNETIPAGSLYPPYPGATSVAWGEWDNPAIVSTWDRSFTAQYQPAAGDAFEPPFVGPQQVVQAEANEDNYYLDEWAQRTAPGIWGDLKAVLDPHPSPADPFTPAELPQPTLSVQERPGLLETLQTLLSGSTGSNQNTGGVVSALPPSSLDTGLGLQAAAKSACLKVEPPGNAAACDVPPVQWIEVQNKAGQWVAPTPSAVDAAVDAEPASPATATGGDAALWAATHRVAGAYPLSYVDYLYAPASGLSAPVADALATVIRYVVTDGQAQLAAHGDGRLSRALVAQSLDAADRLITSNCPAAGGHVVLASAVGRYGPSTPGLQGLGKVDQCLPGAAPTGSTTTTTAPAAGGGAGPAGGPASAPGATSYPPAGGYPPAASSSASGSVAFGGGASGSSPAGPGSGSSPAAGGVAPTAGTGSNGRQRAAAGAGHGSHAGTAGGAGIVAQAASALPLAVPADTSGGVSKLGALVVGAVAFVVLRRLLGGLLTRAVGR